MKNKVDYAYTKMLERLRKDHDEWVDQNGRLNGLWLAMEQIHSEGDMNTDYALEILKKEYEELKKKNEKTSERMFARKDFVIEFENDLDIDSDEVKGIFGY